MAEDSLVIGENSNKNSEKTISTNSRILNLLQNKYFIKTMSILALILISAIIVLPLCVRHNLADTIFLII